METTIKIDGKDVRFKATAAVPRLYRMKFGRDILQDMKSLRKALTEAQTTKEDEGSAESHLSVEALTLFESIAYIMAKHADAQSVPENPDDWLDEFETFSIYQILPEILALWAGNTAAMNLSKKNQEAQIGK